MQNKPNLIFSKSTYPFVYQNLTQNLQFCRKPKTNPIQTQTNPIYLDKAILKAIGIERFFSEVIIRVGLVFICDYLLYKRAVIVIRIENSPLVPPSKCHILHAEIYGIIKELYDHLNSFYWRFCSLFSSFLLDSWASFSKASFKAGRIYFSWYSLNDLAPEFVHNISSFASPNDKSQTLHSISKNSKVTRPSAFAAR